MKEEVGEDCEEKEYGDDGELGPDTDEGRDLVRRTSFTSSLYSYGDCRL